MHMNLMKRMLSLLLVLALLVGNVPAVAFAEETEIPAETEMVAAEETLAPTEAVTEPATPTETATEPAETVTPTEVVTEPAVEETLAPTQPAVPEETVAPTETADEAALEMQWHTIVSDVDLPGNEELHAAYIEQVLYDNRISTLGIAAGNRLSGDEKLLYDALVPYIKEIANGERASTVISVGQQVGNDYIPEEDVIFTETYETDAAVSETVSHAITALLSDLPFEMYWYDKTAGCSYGYLLDKYGNLLYLVFTFPAAVNYAGSGNGTVNTEKTGAAAEAVHNAESIISEYASSSDYEKLVGYRDEICKLVSYNHDAAGTGDFSGNDDPWQLIYVFDGDPNTNVVCEGYSKAFMYLCDLTDFAGEVACYTVSGLMNRGGHMWNIVTIGGSNYMADVTNSDDGSVGMYGGLFLVGGAGSAAEGYSFIGVEYTYDNETKSLWGTGADSILTLASEDYDPNAGGVDENIIASGTCGDNLTWKLDEDGKLIISGTGEMGDFELTLINNDEESDTTRGNSLMPEAPEIRTTSPWADYYQIIKNVIITDGVTSIGNYAFLGCSELTRVEISSSVTNIGDSVFSGCSKLKGIWVDAANSTYCSDASGVLYTKNMDRLLKAPALLSGSYKIPDSVTDIGDEAFRNCSGIMSITLPGGLISIGDYAFSGCKGLTSIELPDNLTDIGDYVFQSCSGLTAIEIPNGVTSIGRSAFAYCTGLTSIQIPDGVTSLGESVFGGCSGLVSIGIPDSVTSIGNGAFSGCSGLTSIEIPNGVTSIGNETFNGCSGLTSIEIPNGVTGIGEWAFVDCSGLTSIEIPDSVSYIGERAFERCSNLTSVTIGDGVTSIGYYAFIDCNLTSVTLGNQVTSIGESAFWSNSGLTSIVFPDSLTSIGGYAFEYCTGLTSITIPGGVTSIGEYAFRCCSNLTEIIFEGGAPRIADHAFGQLFSLTAYYPADNPTWTSDVMRDYGGMVTWIPKCKNHSVITQPAVAPTCTTDGLTEGSYCANCGEVLEAQQTIPALGHTEVIEEAVAATCTASGLTEGKHCSVCGEVLAVQKYINPLGHDMGDWVIITEVGCGTNGLKTRECQRAGCTYNETEVIACEGHTYVDGVCTKCQEVQILHSGTCGENLTYTLNGKYTLTISGTGEMTNYGAYQNNAPWCNQREMVKAIVIENGVTTIGDHAFRICLNVTNVEIPDSVTNIGAGAFYDCESLTSIEVPDSVTGIGSSAFDFCGNLQKITFTGDMPAIADDAFEQVTATAYYPADNATWTEDVMQNYGGNITWEAYGEVEDEPELPVISGDSFVVDFHGAEYLQYLFTPAEDGNYLFYFDTWGGIGFSVCKNDNEEWIECGSWDNPENDYRGISAYLLAGVEYRIIVHDKYGEGLNETIYVAKAVSYDNIWIETEDSICYVDNKVYLKLRGTPELALERAEWTVSDPSVLEIYNSDATNLHMYSLAPGTVTVTVTTETGKTATIELTVLDAPPSGTCGENLTWVLDKEGTLTISGTGEMTTNPWGDSYCEAIKTVVIEDGVTSISRDAFRGCSNLTSVTIADSVTDIVGSAFYECTGLRSITIPSGVKSIGSHTFCKCSNLESVLIENGVETIGPYVFALCNNLKNVVIPDSVVSIGEYAFSWCKSLEEITLPDSIATIGNGAFLKCNSLREIVIPDGVTEIAEGLLEECYSLSSVALPDSITSIGNHAFYRCNLTNITIPSGVTGIGETAFLQCENLTEVIFEGDAPIMASNAFMDVTATAYYPTNNPTWTADVMQNYGGTITWKPYGEPQVLETPVVNAAVNPVTGGGTLSWGHDGEADYYKIYRATSKSGKYKLLETVEGTELEVKVSVGKTYYYKVKAICKADSSLNSGYSSVVKVTGKCAQPEIDVAPKLSSGKPVVKWSKVSGAKKYDVYRATEENGTYKKVKTTTSTSYTDSKATLGVTYYYKVKAIASKSTYNSVFSEIDSCLTILAQPEMELSINKTTGKPVIEWEKVSGAVSYEILRAESEKGEYINLANRTGLTFEDSTAEPDKDYWYKVNAIAENTDLNSIDVTGHQQMIHTTLAKPLVSFGVNSISGKPVLTWEEVDGAVEYKIYRSSKSTKSYKAVETTTELSYTDTSVKAGKGYYYKVIAIGENCKSAYSSYKKLTAKCARPEITAIGADLSSGKPAVKWDKVSGAKKYEVYRATEESGTYKKVKTTTSTSYTDSKAELGKTYYYKVKAIASKSSYNSIESEIRSCLTVLAQPVVTAKNDAATGKPILSWKTVTGAVSYELYRSENGDEFELISTQTELIYTDENTVVDGAYSYKVKAIANDPALNSAESVEASVFCACEKPSISIALDGKKPMVSWDSVEGATKYYVYRSTKKSSGYKKVATVEPEDGESYTDSKAKKGTTYYYKVVAVSENAKSAYSNVVKIKSK